MNKRNSAAQIIQELRKIDLTEKEARCYMTLLKNGSSGVQKIAKSMRLTRPTTYRILENLEQKGLVKMEKDSDKKVKIYKAKSPDELISLLRTKKRRLAEQERELLRIITELRSDYYGDDNDIVTHGVSHESIKVCLKDMMMMDIQEIFVWHTTSLTETPINRDKLALIYDTIRQNRGALTIHEVISDDIPATYTLFEGTIIIADKVYIFTKDDITVINKAVIKKILSMMILYIENTSKSYPC